MKQIVTVQYIMIQGNLKEVAKQLRDLSSKFKTLKDLLDFYTRIP